MQKPPSNPQAFEKAWLAVPTASASPLPAWAWSSAAVVAGISALKVALPGPHLGFSVAALFTVALLCALVYRATQRFLSRSPAGLLVVRADGFVGWLPVHDASNATPLPMQALGAAWTGSRQVMLRLSREPRIDGKAGGPVELRILRRHVDEARWRRLCSWVAWHRDRYL